MLSIRKASLGADKSEADACLSALFLTDPLDDRAKLVQAKGLRVDGTCEWIRTNELYVSWLRSNSQLLWSSGGPGKGKTMLSIFLAEQLEQTTRDLSDTLFLQYFCDNKDEKRNTGVTVIRGLLYQLLQLRPKLFDHILPTFKTQSKSLFASSSLETLWRIFEAMLRDPITGTVYCILDGLDECDENSSEVLLGKFRSLFFSETKPSHHLKMIIVSRDFPQFLPVLLKGVPRIRLDPDADNEIHNDIQRFITERVEQLPAYELCPENLRVYIKKTFEERAQGTFLWVSLVAKALKSCRATEMKRKLDEFPPGLDELYGRMLLQIDVNRRAIAAKILLWVVMAIRPLKLSELGVAIGIETGPLDDFTLADVVRDHILSCGYFLTIKEDDEVGLIHQSAKDYLLRKTRDSNPELEFFRVKEEVGNLEVARKCLNYLQDYAVPVSCAVDRPSFKENRSLPLLSYAALHWYKHARSIACSEDIFDLSLPFYQKESPARQGWLVIGTYLKPEDGFECPHPTSSLLHIVSSLGILPLLQNILSRKWSGKGLTTRMRRSFYVNKKDSRGNFAISFAAWNGHTAVVQLLHANGAKIEASDSGKCTALYLATCRGHTSTVRLLLDMGANIEAKDDVDGEAPLHIAARKGRTDFVQLLIENGAKIEAENLDEETALYLAASQGNTTIVQYLLEMGANIEAADSSGVTPLYAAAMSGYKDMVYTLLEKGASVETEDMLEDVWDDICEHEEIVDLLLEKGAIIPSACTTEDESAFSETEARETSYVKAKTKIAYLFSRSFDSIKK
ncbi:hypothetical protein CJF30_00004577 [Rutstroemia sp. NJR-2017a BBW]|nr:hypothetical protein CJF30_00004577 [Rutstroemia sp. NJR-2017a BBW]